MYLKDYHRKTLLSGEEEHEPRITTYEEEQTALKEAFHVDPPSEDEDLLKPKSKSTDSETQDYASILASDPTTQKLLTDIQSLASKPSISLETEVENEAFLAKYMLSRGWLSKSPPPPPQLYEDDSSEEEKAETFESQYNFRFEQSGDLTTHARTLSSARRGDEKRKRERERKKLLQETQRKKELEEIARLRNLKRGELEEKIMVLEGVAGKGGWTLGDLEGDWDEEEWEKRMSGMFGEEYYNEVEREMRG
jgi:protein KRI1